MVSSYWIITFLNKSPFPEECIFEAVNVQLDAILNPANVAKNKMQMDLQQSSIAQQLTNVPK